MHRSDERRVVQANAFGLRSPCGRNAGVAVTVTLTGPCAKTEVTLHVFVQCDGDVFCREVQDLAVSEALAGLPDLALAGPLRVVTTYSPPDPARQT
ncbi:hypothetical protein PANO111632_02325 [Paracoccus nototheniae]